jgi:hypothetical protein
VSRVPWCTDRVTHWGPSAPTRPRLARSLRRLGAAVDDRWPHRRRTADGWIGDAAHQARASDHNPDRRGIVHAIDVTCDGIQPEVLVTAAINHPATHYVIWRREIWSSKNGFRPIPYDGPDPHTTHVHISIAPYGPAERTTQPWRLG